MGSGHSPLDGRSRQLFQQEVEFPAPTLPSPERTGGRWRWQGFKATLAGHRVVAASAVLVGLCVAAYANMFPNEFVFDDRYIIVNNYLIRSLKNLPLLFTTNYWGFIHDVNSGLYRPLVVTSFALNFLVNKLNPWGYHLVNLLLHIAGVLLLYHVSARLIGRRDVALMIAALFAVEPIHTEAVTGIVGRAELLAFVFVFLSLAFYMRAREPGTAGYVLSLAASLTSFFLGLLSKENAASLVGLVVVYDLIYRLAPAEGSVLRRVWLIARSGFWGRYVWYLAVFGGYWFLRYVVLDVVSKTETTPIPFLDNPIAYVPAAVRALTALKVLGKYLVLLFIPTRFSADYSYNQIAPSTSFFEPAVLWVPVLAIVVLAYSVYALRSGRKGPLFGSLFFVVTFSPVSNILFPIGTVMGERLMYLPSAGSSMVVVLALEHLYAACRARRIAPAVMRMVVLVIFCLAVGYYSYKTVERNRDWRTDIALFESALRVSPNSAKVHNNMGIAMAYQNRLEEALAEHRRALDIFPRYADAHNDLGNLLRRTGKLDEAIAEYRLALRVSPRFTKPMGNLGAALYEKGMVDTAITVYKKALDINPYLAKERANLGLAYFRKGLLPQALDEYKKALKINPFLVEARANLGLAYFTMGRVEEAVEEYRRALRLNPGMAEVRTYLGAAYLRMGRMDEAIRELRWAVELKPSLAEAHGYLGLAYLNMSFYDLAVEEYRRALELEPHLPDAYNKLGIAYFRMGRADEALSAFKKAVELRPDYAEAHNYLGILYFRAKLYDEAIAEYRRALEAQPDLAELHAELGLTYFEKGMPDEAIAEYEKAIALRPDFAEVHNNLAAAYYHKKDYAKALLHADKAASLGKVNARLLEVLKPYQ